MTTPTNTQSLIRVGDRWALVLDDATLGQLGIDAETRVRVDVAEGTLRITPLNAQGRAAMFESALKTMSARYEKTLRRLAE